MAEVFEGELAGELGFVRKVAIKRMLADAATDPLAARRFLDEARIASRLHHANIVAVLDVGVLDGLPFQVLELVDGINAEQLLARAGGALPLDVALYVAAEVAHALGHAHAAHDDAGALGIVHRDVKPSNVLVAWTGDVKLADFGIAVARGREARTAAGMVTGTLGFMSPEQRTRGVVDERSDVYALGLTLHALIAGRSPIDGAAAEQRVLAGEPPALDAAIPDDVRRVLAGALAPERRDRPNANELADQLGRALAPRMVRDGRAVLRDFLAPFRHGGPKRGALDELLGLDVVPIAPGEPAGPGDGGRGEPSGEPNGARELVPAQFELRRTELREPHEPKTTALATPDPVADEQIAIATDKLRRRRFGVIALVAAVVIGMGGMRLIIYVRRARIRNAVAAGTALPDAKPAAAVATAPVDAGIIIDAADVAVAPADAAPAIATPVATGAHHSIARTVPIAARPDAGAAATATAGTGYLQVTGDDLIGSKVLVDGVVAGYPPAKLEVARGRHVVTVEKRDGTRLPPQTVEVTDLDTLVHPARLHW